MASSCSARNPGVGPKRRQQLLKQFGGTRGLASPKLMVLNNQTAVLKVVENTGGTPPTVTLISPNGQYVPVTGSTYSVNVRATGAWAVEIPTSVTWLTAAVAGSPAPLEGIGNGSVSEAQDSVLRYVHA